MVLARKVICLILIIVLMGYIGTVEARTPKPTPTPKITPLPQVSAQIQSVTFACSGPYGSYENKVPTDIKVKNTGNAKSTFKVIYSVRNQEGNNFDAPASDITLNPGKATTLKLYWTVPTNAVEGWYAASVAVLSKDFSTNYARWGWQNKAFYVTNFPAGLNQHRNVEGSEPAAVDVSEFLNSVKEIEGTKNKKKAGETLKNLQTQRGKQRLGSLSGGGPKVRFVQDPISPDSQIIDMRHFLVVGQRGTLFGLGVEKLQKCNKDDPTSAGNPQDLFSNWLGSRFFLGYYNSNGYLSEQLKTFFDDRKNGKVLYNNNNPSDYEYKGWHP